ncbi:MAG: 30S ribosomal protein S20 [Clostridiales bacterium]|nr:30S ribosomal protein S20 [Clostridiales bacterium]
MANIKSSQKRVLLSRAQNARNKSYRSQLRTSLKKFDAAVAQSDKEAAGETYKVAVKAVDHAVSKGLLHKNNAARKKSSLTLRLNALTK